MLTFENTKNDKWFRRSVSLHLLSKRTLGSREQAACNTAGVADATVKAKLYVLQGRPVQSPGLLKQETVPDINRSVVHLNHHPRKQSLHVGCFAVPALITGNILHSQL